jgi:hypothetical protein
MANDSDSNSSGNAEWLNAHLNSVRTSIEREASVIAEAGGREAVEPRDIAQAALRFAPGDKFPVPVPPSRLDAWGINGVTVVSALLALAFGGLGAYLSRNGVNSGALDIAKIFAGAIVGSAGASVAATASRRKA